MMEITSTTKSDSWICDTITLNDGTKLVYFQNGVGKDKTILFINPGLGATEQENAIYLNNMADDFNCVSIDFRGFGKSIDAKREFSASEFHRDAEDAAEVMESLGYPRYSIFGDSDGANVGIILAAKHSERVENLIIQGAQTFLTNEDLMIYGAMADLANWHPDMLEGKLKSYNREKLQELVEKAYGTFSEIVAKGGEICVAEAKRVICPTLIFKCGLDVVHGVTTDHAQFLKDNIRNSTLHVFPDAGWTVRLEKFPETKLLTTNFIKKGNVAN